MLFAALLTTPRPALRSLPPISLLLLSPQAAAPSCKVDEIDLWSGIQLEMADQDERPTVHGTKDHVGIYSGLYRAGAEAAGALQARSARMRSGQPPAVATTHSTPMRDACVTGQWFQ